VDVDVVLTLASISSRVQLLNCVLREHILIIISHDFEFDYVVCPRRRGDLPWRRRINGAENSGVNRRSRPLLHLPRLKWHRQRGGGQGYQPHIKDTTNSTGMAETTVKAKDTTKQYGYGQKKNYGQGQGYYPDPAQLFQDFARYGGGAGAAAGASAGNQFPSYYQGYG